MKKTFAVLLVMLGVLSGCTSDPAADQNNMQPAPPSESDVQEQEEKKKDEESMIPGDYDVPDGWVKSETYSNARQIFYVEEGKEDSTQPDNISINVGENKYSAEEHTKFKDAILRQIMMQIQGQDVELDGTGTHTEQDYVVYIFTITEKESGIVTKQYYIVDDYRFCLIQLTNFTGSEAADEAAQQMMDSFVWDDKEEEAVA